MLALRIRPRDVSNISTSHPLGCHRVLDASVTKRGWATARKEAAGKMTSTINQHERYMYADMLNGVLNAVSSQWVLYVLSLLWNNSPHTRKIGTVLVTLDRYKSMQPALVILDILTNETLNMVCAEDNMNRVKPAWVSSIWKFLRTRYARRWFNKFTHPNYQNGDTQSY